MKLNSVFCFDLSSSICKVELVDFIAILCMHILSMLSVNCRPRNIKSQIKTNEVKCVCWTGIELRVSGGWFWAGRFCIFIKNSMECFLVLNEIAK